MVGAKKRPAGEGTLFLVGTPIGNLEDMTLRGLRILEEADLIACEDTRRTKKLLSHFNIHTPVTSYHEHSGQGKLKELLLRVRSGQKVAVVSDAGMPAISDPGRELVAQAVAEGLHLAVIPGPSALTSALVVSGLPPQPFTFFGFCPRTNKERRKLLQELASIQWTAVFYEAPHRLVETLKDLSQCWPSRPVAVAREITKAFEEVVRGSAEEVYRHFLEHEPRGEITVIVGRADPAEAEKDRSKESPSVLAQALREAQAMAEEGYSLAQAAKASAQKYRLPRRTIYRGLIEKTPPQGGSEEG